MSSTGTSRQQAHALAAELGVSVDSFWTGTVRGQYVPTWGVEWDIEAPDGMVWNATGSHTLTFSWDAERGHPDAKAGYWWASLVRDLKAGLSLCGERPGCEWCDH
jgi:hypothetical protein